VGLLSPPAGFVLRAGARRETADVARGFRLGRHEVNIAFAVLVAVLTDRQRAELGP
jgi:hypothetical protein